MKNDLVLTFRRKSIFSQREAMKKYIVVIVIILLSLTGCASLDSREDTVPQKTVPQDSVPQDTVPKETVPQVTVPQGLDTYSGLSEALAAGDRIFLYDVRTSEEYESGHIPGAVNIPHYDIAAKLPISKKNDIIVVYCAGGVRSYSACQWLSDKGFNYVFDFGALWNWEGELVKGPDQYISK